MCVVLSVGDRGMDVASNSSVLSNLSHQYVTTQRGATGSSQHATGSAAYSTQLGGGDRGYFASEGEQSTGPGSLPGINLTSCDSDVVLCEYSKFRIELNSYFSIRFETSTIIRNFQILTVTNFLLI